jgi:hypothetical protein
MQIHHTHSIQSITIRTIPINGWLDTYTQCSSEMNQTTSKN